MKNVLIVPLVVVCVAIYPSPATANQDDPESIRIERFLKVLEESGTDIAWGESTHGLELGIATIRDGQRFKRGESLHFTLLIRNSSQTAVRLGYQWPKGCSWIAPTIETAGGKVTRVISTHFRGGHKTFTETLAPGEVTLVRLLGIVGLGAEGRASQWSPYIAEPKPGEYRMAAAIRPYLADEDGKRRGKHFKLDSGFVNFQIVTDTEAEDAGSATGAASEKLQPTLDIPQTPPVWGEAVNGIQLGVSGIVENQEFPRGQRVAFVLQVRNTSDKPVQFGYRWMSSASPFLAPVIEDGDGHVVRLDVPHLLPDSVIDRTVPRETIETVGPDAIVTLKVMGIVGLGEQPSLFRLLPFIAEPQPGKYRLRARVYPYLVGADGPQRRAAFELTSGRVNFQITDVAQKEDASTPTKND